MYQFSLLCTEANVIAAITALRDMRAKKFAAHPTDQLTDLGETIYEVTYTAPETITTGLEL